MSRTIWIVDDDPSIRFVLERALTRPDTHLESFPDASTALDAAQVGLPDLVLTDIRMPGKSGLELLDWLAENAPQVPVVVMTAYSDLDTTVTAYARGAHEYLPKPFDIDELLTLTERALEKSEPDLQTRALGSEELLGDSPVMQQTFRSIGRLARSRLGVLISGETGTGKELIARALHRHSPRGHGPFIALNTAAIPAELLESELFGHEKGAFTGAQQRHRGRFEQANGGTLFLDEIGDMPASLQTRLLRVLAEGEFYRVGGHELIKVDVRVVTATHQDLRQRVRDGSFREDLFHRLDVVQINAPPLRERGQDVLLLAETFLGQAAAETALEPRRLDAASREMLMAHAWPGNVRELKNLCWRLTVMAPGPVIRAEDLGALLQEAAADQTGSDWQSGFERWFRGQLDDPDERLMNLTQDRLQAIMLRLALEKTGGRREAAAQLLGCGRNTLTRRLKELGISDED
jgi:two-component system nitrogen regulation response regulator GlnG